MLTTLRKLLNKNPLRDMSETDRKVLAICMGAALVFWLILNLSRSYTIRKTVSFNYLLAPERALAKTTPRLDAMDISVEGSGWDLLWESLWFQEIAVDFDLREQEKLNMTNSELNRLIRRQLSSGDLTVGNLDFDRQTFLTSIKFGKKVPVVSRVNIEFADGFTATSSPTFFPDSIVVEGAEDLKDDIFEWPTSEITLKDVEGDLNQIIELAPSKNSLTASRTTVTMKLSVEAFIQRTLEIPVTVINAPQVDSFQVIPQSVMLRVTLPQSSYHAIEPDDFGIVADLGGIRNINGKNSVPLTLQRQPLATISATMETKAVEYYLIK